MINLFTTVKQTATSNRSLVVNDNTFYDENLKRDLPGSTQEALTIWCTISFRLSKSLSKVVFLEVDNSSTTDRNFLF